MTTIPLELICPTRLPASLVDKALDEFGALNWDDICWFMHYWSYPGRSSSQEILALIQWLSNQVWSVRQYGDSEEVDVTLAEMWWKSYSRPSSRRDDSWSEQANIWRKDPQAERLMETSRPQLWGGKLPPSWNPANLGDARTSGLKVAFVTKEGATIPVQEGGFTDRVYSLRLNAQKSKELKTKNKGLPPAKFFLIAKQGETIYGTLLRPTRHCQLEVSLGSGRVLLDWSLTREVKTTGWRASHWVTTLVVDVHTANPRPLTPCRWTLRQNLWNTSTAKATKELLDFWGIVVAQTMMCTTLAEHLLSSGFTCTPELSLQKGTTVVALGYEKPQTTLALLVRTVQAGAANIQVYPLTEEGAEACMASLMECEPLLQC